MNGRIYNSEVSRQRITQPDWEHRGINAENKQRKTLYRWRRTITQSRAVFSVIYIAHGYKSPAKTSHILQVLR